MKLNATAFGNIFLFVPFIKLSKMKIHLSGGFRREIQPIQCKPASQ